MQRTVEDLLAAAIAAERKALVFYEGLMHLFRHVPDVAALWRDMMQDEEEHLQILEEVSARLTPEQRCAPADLETLYKAIAAVRFSPERSLASIRDLNDAYEIVHDLEHGEINAVFAFILGEYVDDETRERMADAYLSIHLRRLQALGGVEWRQRVRALEEIPPNILPGGKDEKPN